MNQQNINNYDVLTPIKHDGEHYRPDDDEKNTVVMTARQAAPLLSLNPPAIAERRGGQQFAERPALRHRPDNSADVFAAIRAAVEVLDPGNREHWNRDGKTPAVDAIEAVLDWEGGITAKERDEALDNR